MAYQGSDAPAGDSQTVVLDTPFTKGIAKALYVGGGGDITLITLRGTTQLFSAVPQGSILPQACKQVNTLGTTASLLVAMFE